MAPVCCCFFYHSFRDLISSSYARLRKLLLLHSSCLARSAGYDA
jgi:hypothetical protein